MKTKCKVLAFDMRGHGDTTVPVEGMSVENVVGDIKTVYHTLIILLIEVVLWE
jgi:hypothetical protein